MISRLKRLSSDLFDGGTSNAKTRLPVWINYEIANTDNSTARCAITRGGLEDRVVSWNGRCTNSRGSERDLLTLHAERQMQATANSQVRRSRKSVLLSARVGMKLQLGTRFRLGLKRAQLPYSDARRPDGSKPEAMWKSYSRMPAQRILPTSTATPHLRSVYALGTRTTSIQQKSSFPVLSSQKDLEDQLILCPDCWQWFRFRTQIHH